jgi:hypothetical protein
MSRARPGPPAWSALVSVQVVVIVNGRGKGELVRMQDCKVGANYGGRRTFQQWKVDKGDWGKRCRNDWEMRLSIR